MAEATVDDNVGYSSTVEYDVLWNNRQERKRTTTDVACFIIYDMFIVAWIGIAIYAYNDSTVSPFMMVRLVMETLRTSLFFSPAIFFFTWFCVLLIVFYFIMLRWCTRFTVYLTLTLEFIFITLLLVALIFRTHPVIFVVLLFCYALFWIEIQIFRKVGIDFVCRIIVDTCKAMIALPSSLLIALFSLFSTAMLAIFIATVVYCLVNAKFIILEQSHSTAHYFIAAPSIKFVNNTALIITFLFFSGWIVSVNYLCMQSILHGMFASWCRMTNKSIIPNLVLLRRHVFYAYRYHIGSFAFMSVPVVPIIQIVRTICANVQMIDMKFKESPYNIYCLLVIIGDVCSSTSVVCASYGKCFYPSMKDAFTVLIQNPLKFTAARLVITGMITFGLIFIPFIVIGMTGAHIAIWNIHDFGIYLIVISSISIIITSVVFFIFTTAVDSVLFCHLEELLKNTENMEDDQARQNNLV